MVSLVFFVCLFLLLPFMLIWEFIYLVALIHGGKAKKQDKCSIILIACDENIEKRQILNIQVS